VNRLYPRSFLRLILIGFGLVSLPLVFALGNAAYNVQRLAELSAGTVQQATVAARSSREMLESLTAMERALRQYLVLREAALIEDYRRERRDFVRAAREFAALPLARDAGEHLLAFVVREQKLAESLGGDTPSSTAQPAVELAAVAQSVRGVLDGTRGLIDVEVERLRQTAQDSRNVLVWQMLAAIPIALVIALWFRSIISAQLRQFDRAIRSIGHAEYSDGVTVAGGPQDLAYLGRRLDWLRRRLAELEEEKNRFLRHVSHDLKTPLTALREGTQLLAEGVPGALTEQQKAIVDILDQNSQRLQKLIEELLDFQQAGFAAAAIDPQPVALDVVCTQVVRTHRLVAAARGIRFERRLDPVIVEGDADRLRVVIDNLVTNAIKFSPREGAVHLDLAGRDGVAVLEVHDEGPGVAEEERQRVFEPFFRGTRVRRGTVKGSGLGLAIAKEHVVAHHGKIEVVEGSGRGAHFRVTLPVKWERKKAA